MNKPVAPDWMKEVVRKCDGDITKLDPPVKKEIRAFIKKVNKWEEYKKEKKKKKKELNVTIGGKNLRSLVFHIGLDKKIVCMKNFFGIKKILLIGTVISCGNVIVDVKVFVL